MRTCIVSLAATLPVFAASVAMAADLNVGVIVDGAIKPGVYGRIEIGNHPPPVLYPQPVIIVKDHHPRYQPVYLHVPPGHAKKWSKHCRKYDACDRPVYFVKSEEYEPGYGHNHKKKKKHGHDDD